MIALLSFFLTLLVSSFKSKGRLEAENAALRHQLIVLRRKVCGRVQLTNGDRLFLVLLYRLFPSVLRTITIIRPETLLRWHRAGFRRYWRWRSRSFGGRPQIDVDLRALIRRMNVTTHPTADWIARQITEAFPWAEAPRYLIRDRDCVYGAAVTHRLRTMGIRDKPIAPGSPWQNGFAERLIGSIPRECVDHLVVLGEAHLRRILTKYAGYYNELRTHRSLNKDAPIHRAIQHAGHIVSAPILGGLHHHYCRI
jgi:transposase InsO family protein